MNKAYKNIQMKSVSCFVVSVFLVLFAVFSQAAETVKVASIFAKTGVAAEGNKSAIDGIRFAVEELNLKGGLLGKELEIIEFDNHSTPLHSKKVAEEAAAEGVVAVFGANWSSHSLAMAPVMQGARIPMISTFSTNPEVTRVGDYIFRVCFIDSFQGNIMARFATRDLHAKKAAILINTSSRYSEGLAEFFMKNFISQGGDIVLAERYLKDTKDFSPHLNKIAALAPDILFVPGNIVDSAGIIRQAREIGVSMPILGGDGWGDSMYAHAGAALDGNFFPGTGMNNTKMPKVLNLSEHFAKRPDLS